jgi:hypothetical protein
MAKVGESSKRKCKFSENVRIKFPFFFLREEMKTKQSVISVTASQILDTEVREICRDMLTQKNTTAGSGKRHQQKR